MEHEGPRTAIVTGGAKRIGAELARALAADGWHLLIHYHHSQGEAEALAAELGHAAIVRADLADPGAAEIILGAAVLVTGMALLTGNRVAYVITVVFGVISVIANLLVLPAYPIWSVLIIATDFMVIYAICVHGHELREN